MKKISFVKILTKAVSMTMVFVLLFAGSAVASFAAEIGTGYLLVTDGVPVNSGADVSDRLQSLIDNNPHRTIFFPDGEYLISKPIYTPADPNRSVSLKLADFAIIKAIGAWQPGEAMIQLGGKLPYNNTHINGSNYSFEGGIVDGSGVANGISINSGRETAVRNVSIKNTVIGIHIMYGANNGSSDSDISGVNIIGTGTTDSIGVLLDGLDNTLTNMRIGYVFTGVHIKSSGNVLRNIHPLYYSDGTDYQNSCGFLEEKGNNWYDFCYSDQFSIGFRSTGGGASTLNDCFCYWYSPDYGYETGYRADKKFNSTITNFKLGFRDSSVNTVLSVGKLGGNGTIDNLEVDEERLADRVYQAYLVDCNIFERILGYIMLLFSMISKAS